MALIHSKLPQLTSRGFWHQADWIDIMWPSLAGFNVTAKKLAVRRAWSFCLIVATMWRRVVAIASITAVLALCLISRQHSLTLQVIYTNKHGHTCSKMNILLVVGNSNQRQHSGKVYGWHLGNWLSSMSTVSHGHGWLIWWLMTSLQLPRQIEGDLAEYTGSLTGDQVLASFLCHQSFHTFVTVVNFNQNHSGIIAKSSITSLLL